jgi:ATP-binding cassette subfamily F protein uup
VDLQLVTVRRTDRVLFEGLSLTISDGDRLGVVGINGTGKSTLLRLLSGVDTPEEGHVRRGRGSRVGYLDQVPVLPPGTVRAAVGEGWEAEAALDRLGMSSAVDEQVATLSGGQAKRVALAGVLTHPAELLVLDEPTNHLDLGAVAWLEHRLLSFRGGLVLVTHDRHLLDRLTTRMLELDRGHAYVHEGGYVSYLEAKADREEQAASAESTRQNLARRELAWLRRGAKARSRKPQARIDAALRVIEDRPEASVGSVAIETQGDTPRLGDKVIECAGVSFRYDEGPVVLSGVDLVLGRRERLGIVGANGTGKSTLLDLLAGRRRPTTGTVTVGPTVVTGYYDQQGSELDLQARLQDLVAGPHRSPGSLADIELMKRFSFSGELPFARVGTLSGGERRRLQLLLVIAGRPNVMFLDEPTNDFDLDTLRILEDFLEDWPGALVVVSHDRTFLDRTTERLVAVQTDGTVAAVPGGVAGWIARVEGGDLRRAGALPSSVPAPSRPPATRARGSGLDPNGVPTGRLLREAEKNVSRLARERDRIIQSLTVADGYEEMTRLGTELAETQAALEKSEDAWLALAEEAESGSVTTSDQRSAPAPGPAGGGGRGPEAVGAERVPCRYSLDGIGAGPPPTAVCGTRRREGDRPS